MANEDLALYLASQKGLNPDVLSMMLKAMSPKTDWAAKVGEGGETTFTNVPPETKAAKEKEKEGTQGQPGQPTKAKNIGFGPAMAAMTAPTGEPISAAELRGLTPEQISSVMGMEARTEQLRQGTIGQLMDLPYRQAMTEKAMRPDVSLELARINKMLNPLQQGQLRQLGIEIALRGVASGKSIDFLKGLPPSIIAAMDLPAQVLSAMYREEKLPKKAEWLEWRNKKTGEIKPMRPGTAPTPGVDWERVPTKEIVYDPLRRERFEYQKATTSAKARASIKKAPKDKKTKGIISRANEGSMEPTLMVWKYKERPWWPDINEAIELRLPIVEGRQMVADDFPPTAAEMLGKGEGVSLRSPSGAIITFGVGKDGKSVEVVE